MGVSRFGRGGDAWSRGQRGRCDTATMGHRDAERISVASQQKSGGDVPRKGAGAREDDPLRRIREETLPRLQRLPLGGRKPWKRRQRKKEKKRKAKVKVQLEAPVKDVFKNTALDPDANVRHELMRKARKIRKGKKKKKRGSRSRSKESSGDESGESSDSSSLGEKHIATSELFESERRSLRLWRRVPGALTNAAILDMQEQMMTCLLYTSPSPRDA